MSSGGQVPTIFGTEYTRSHLKDTADLLHMPGAIMEDGTIRPECVHLHWNEAERAFQHEVSQCAMCRPFVPAFTGMATRMATKTMAGQENVSMRHMPHAFSQRGFDARCAHFLYVRSMNGFAYVGCDCAYCKQMPFLGRFSAFNLPDEENPRLIDAQGNPV